MGGAVPQVGDILDHWEQRVVAVVPGDLSHNHRGGPQPHLQVLTCLCRADWAHGGQAPVEEVGGRGMVWSSTSGRRAQALEDHIHNWVRGAGGAGRLAQTHVNTSN